MSQQRRNNYQFPGPEQGLPTKSKALMSVLNKVKVLRDMAYDFHQGIGAHRPDPYWLPIVGLDNDSHNILWTAFLTVGEKFGETICVCLLCDHLVTINTYNPIVEVMYSHLHSRTCVDGRWMRMGFSLTVTEYFKDSMEPNFWQVFRTLALFYYQKRDAGWELDERRDSVYGKIIRDNNPTTSQAMMSSGPCQVYATPSSSQQFYPRSSDHRIQFPDPQTIAGRQAMKTQSPNVVRHTSVPGVAQQSSSSRRNWNFPIHVSNLSIGSATVTSPITWSCVTSTPPPQMSSEMMDVLNVFQYQGFIEGMVTGKLLEQQQLIIIVHGCIKAAINPMRCRVDFHRVNIGDRAQVTDIKSPRHQTGDFFFGEISAYEYA